MLNLDAIMPNSFGFSNATEIPLYGYILEEPLANYIRDGNIDTAQPSTPRSLTVLPIIIPNPNNDTTQPGAAAAAAILGVAGAEIEWITLLDNVTPTDAPTVCIVLQNTCGQAHTYHVKGGIASYLSSGDAHDSSYDDLAQSVSVANAMQDVVNAQAVSHDGYIMATTMTHYQETTTDDEPGFCMYTFTVYPTLEYEETFHTGLAYIYMSMTVVLAALSIVLFIVYSVLVERRQKQVLDSAAKSKAIINSLFPAVVRRRLFGAASTTTKGQTTDSPGGGGCCSSVLRNPLRQRRRRTAVQRDAHNPKTRLTNFLTLTSPNDVYSMEHQSDEPIAEMFSNTTIVSLLSLFLALSTLYSCRVF